MMNEDTKTEAKPVSQILATVALLSAQPTTPQPSQDSKESLKQNEQRRLQWQDKWLPLKITHPALNALRDSIYFYCAGYAKNPRAGRTLIIYGENGTGKTRTTRHVAHWAKRIALKIPQVADGDENSVQVPECRRVHWPSIVDGFKKQEFAIIEDLIRCCLLIIDDVGAEHDPSGFGKEQLYILLSRREQRWNLITTNLPPSEWDRVLERRIASRFFRNSEHVDLSGVSDYSTT